MINVVFVCLGNICRSPMAEGIFRDMVRKEGLDQKIAVDSAGTSDWHIGDPPHKGTLGIFEKYGVSAEGLKARQYKKEDIQGFDYIIAMDASNIENMEKIQGGKSSKVTLLLDLLDDVKSKDVPDPYFTGDFEETYRLVTEGCRKLLDKIKIENQL